MKVESVVNEKSIEKCLKYPALVIYRHGGIYLVTARQTHIDRTDIRDRVNIALAYQAWKESDEKR